MAITRRSLLLVLLVLAGNLSAQESGLLRVLFLGNSLTDGNNVPALVQEMAQQQGVAIECVGVAPGGYDLSDHWTAGHASLLSSRMYDVLVLQQGPSSEPASQTHLREWAIHWTAEARRHNTAAALYMVWPVRTTNAFALVSQSYRNAATAANIPIFPAGEVWQQVMQNNPSIQLYTNDNLHATPAGSFLAAMVISRGLYSLDPARVPTRVNNITIPTSTLDVFRNAVATLPAQTLSGLTPPSPTDPSTPPPNNPPPPSLPPFNTPTGGGSTGGDGGGGAPSLVFVAALMCALAGRCVFGIRPHIRDGIAEQVEPGLRTGFLRRDPD